MNNNNYLFYRKYFNFEKSLGDFSENEIIQEVINRNSRINNHANFLRLSPQEKTRLKESAIISINSEILKGINKEILDSEIQNIEKVDSFKNGQLTDFTLTTTYPGLLMGTGYSHDYKASADETTQEGFKIGFYFDYTNGMPVITGSTLKGLLRSCFPQRIIKSKNRKGKSPKYKNEKENFIKEELKKLGISEEVNIDELEAEIFDGKRKIRNDNKEIWQPFSIYKRDLFIEAVPIAKTHRLFENDALAVHYENLLKNPKPIKFLKVSPNVTYEFKMNLNDSQVVKSLTKVKKIELFKNLLLTIGIGAKTNVGYGQFSEAPIICNQCGKSGKKAEDAPKASTVQPGAYSSHQKKSTERTSGNKGVLTDPQDNTKTNYTAPSNIAINHTPENSLKVEDRISATVVEIEDKNIKVMFHVAEKSKLKIPFPDKYATYKIGQELPLIVTVMNEGKIKGVKKQKN